jgi:hypothetical protein
MLDKQIRHVRLEMSGVLYNDYTALLSQILVSDLTVLNIIAQKISATFLTAYKILRTENCPLLGFDYVFSGRSVRTFQRNLLRSSAHT